jgi:hypothetical protein
MKNRFLMNGSILSYLLIDYYTWQEIFDESLISAGQNFQRLLTVSLQPLK